MWRHKFKILAVVIVVYLFLVLLHNYMDVSTRTELHTTLLVKALGDLQAKSANVGVSFYSPLSSSIKETQEIVSNLFKKSAELQHAFSNTFDKFTIVMPTYNRTETLSTIFHHYCEMPDIIDQIVVVWNNIGELVPQKVQEYSCKVPIKFLLQKTNRLINRFIPYPEIKTDCVLSLDDDRLVPKEALQFGFQVWKNSPHLVVGYVARTHGRKNGKYYYRKRTVRHGEKYSIILTVAAFLHVKYLDLFTNVAPQEIRDFVNKYQNGEDLGMLAVVSNHLSKIDEPQCACLWVREECQSTKLSDHGLHKQSHHFEERTECLNMLSDIYGTLPLQYCSLEVRKTKKRND